MKFLLAALLISNLLASPLLERRSPEPKPFVIEAIKNTVDKVAGVVIPKPKSKTTKPPVQTTTTPKTTAPSTTASFPQVTNIGEPKDKIINSNQVPDDIESSKAEEQEAPKSIPTQKEVSSAETNIGTFEVASSPKTNLATWHIAALAIVGVGIVFFVGGALFVAKRRKASDNATITFPEDPKTITKRITFGEFVKNTFMDKPLPTIQTSAAPVMPVTGATLIRPESSFSQNYSLNFFRGSKNSTDSLQNIDQMLQHMNVDLELPKAT
jgi:hypothetical protein